MGNLPPPTLDYAASPQKTAPPRTAEVIYRLAMAGCCAVGGAAAGLALAVLDDRWEIPSILIVPLLTVALAPFIVVGVQALTWSPIPFVRLFQVGGNRESKTDPERRGEARRSR